MQVFLYVGVFLMLDENTGYAVGNNQYYLGDAKPGAIYKTSNGGTTWITSQ